MRNIFIVLFLAFIVSSCKKNSDDITNPPNVVDTLATLTTAPFMPVTIATAVSGGNITNDGGAAITARGVCWSTSTNPTIAGNHTTDSSGTGTFISHISGLGSNITYYVRAYATNSAGTAYGNEDTLTTAVADVYAGGYEMLGFAPVAKVWKNGVPTALTSGQRRARVHAVVVSGTDVYAVGYEDNVLDMPMARIWKNGVSTLLTLPANTGVANSVCVSGNDVYVAGSENDGVQVTAKVWKNGVAVPSLTSSTLPCTAISIIVKGNDIYVAGDTYNGTIKTPTVWVNGVATLLPNSGDSRVNGMYISGQDIYVVGTLYVAPYTAKLWKNGVETSISDNIHSAQGTSVFVSGQDVFVGGCENTSAPANLLAAAKLWKNGVATTLTNTMDSTGLVKSVYVSGANVYAAGLEHTPGGTLFATIWKNSIATRLTDGSNEAAIFSIFVNDQ